MYLTLVAISLCRGVISYVNIFKIDIIIPVKQQWFYIGAVTRERRNTWR